MQPRELRYRAVVHYKFFLPSLRKVARLYNVSKSSLQRWIHNDPTIRKVRSKKQADQRVRQCVKEFIEDNPFATWAMAWPTVCLGRESFRVVGDREYTIRSRQAID